MELSDLNPTAGLEQVESVLPSLVSGDEMRFLLETVDNNLLLLIDIRSLQHFFSSRIKGALSICIPTVLLKRPSFGTQNLLQQFEGGAGCDKLARWPEMQWIIVYDMHASGLDEASPALTMIKKFTRENFAGRIGILFDGFCGIQRAFPELVDSERADASSVAQPDDAAGLVIGGVLMPPQSGTGHDPVTVANETHMAHIARLDLSVPKNVDRAVLPRWLRDAVSRRDQGMTVRNNFLRLEVDEFTRKKDAFSQYLPRGRDTSEVEIYGVELHDKNRYNDIIPYYHARVRVQSNPRGSCDYFNGSYLKSLGSRKEYVATQGPLPATYEDFWSVVWEQDVRVVVMLTAECELGQNKCDPYWEGSRFGCISLTRLSEAKVPLDVDAAPAGADDHCLIVRKFMLQRVPSEETKRPKPARKITQLQFSSWPEYGTPAKPHHLLAVIEYANLMQNEANLSDPPSPLWFETSLGVLHPQSPVGDEEWAAWKARKASAPSEAQRAGIKARSAAMNARSAAIKARSAAIQARMEPPPAPNALEPSPAAIRAHKTASRAHKAAVEAREAAAEAHEAAIKAQESMAAKAQESIAAKARMPTATRAQKAAHRAQEAVIKAREVAIETREAATKAREAAIKARESTATKVCKLSAAIKARGASIKARGASIKAHRASIKAHKAGMKARKAASRARGGGGRARRGAGRAHRPSAAAKAHGSSTFTKTGKLSTTETVLKAYQEGTLAAISERGELSASSKYWDERPDRWGRTRPMLAEDAHCAQSSAVRPVLRHSSPMDRPDERRTEARRQRALSHPPAEAVAAVSGGMKDAADAKNADL
ncbi:hypothetical protein DCS_08116 [Drechmeria coniospora]|uniref:Tyrosine-protein phosphatase domain-containing protein n=1 Tax=Drechmeria coniospora TaxID=98403 RepID=A0A151GGC7_DRECN|nr:hypothetical protein DCS_08116 [Drechmeria coniospora]KYK56149.1 hypothetical protein DCS_08116 [Drechmeria coniospora]